MKCTPGTVVLTVAAVFLKLVTRSDSVPMGQPDSAGSMALEEWSPIKMGDHGARGIHPGRQRAPRRSAREVDPNQADGRSSQRIVTCNVDSGQPCFCYSQSCSITASAMSNIVPLPTMVPALGNVTATQQYNCCVQVLSSSDLLQIVTIRLAVPSIANYTPEMEGTLKMAIVDNLRDYCHWTIEKCGLTSDEAGDTSRLFTPAGVFITHLDQTGEGAGAEGAGGNEHPELQVSFVVYVNALDDKWSADSSGDTPAHSRALSADVIVAMIASRGREIGIRLGVVVLTPTYRWRDIEVILPSPTPSLYPLGLGFWQYVWMCIGSALGIFFVIISFISSVKAVIDRKRIKRRIRERREQRLRQKAEKEESSGNDKEPLTTQANGGASGCDVKVKEASDGDVTPNAHVVQVTVHDIQSNGPTTALASLEMTVDLDNIVVKDAVADVDSAIDSESNSYVETNPDQNHASVQFEGEGTPQLRHSGNIQEVQDQNKPDVSSVCGDEHAQDSWEGLSAGMDGSPIRQSAGRDAPNNKSVYGLQNSDNDVKPALSTPERKKAGIMTPPKFFSPKKQKGESLMVQSPSLGEKEVGLDNMAFDLVGK